MSENNQNENRTFQTSSRSRKRVKRQKSWLIIPLTLLLLLIVAALFFVVRYAIRRFGGTPAESTPIESTSAPEQTQPSGSPSAGNTETPAGTSGQEPLSTTEGNLNPPPTETEPPVTEPPATEPPVLEEFHLYTATEVLPLPDDVDRGFFEDVNASDANGSWWCGKKVRDPETGEERTEYDRHKPTLETLEKYGAIYRKNTDQKVAYLTFDCGYEYGYTASILDTLKEKNVKAVFFVAGDFVNDQKNRDLLLRMYNEGHIIGSHTDHHHIMPKETDESFIMELNGLQLKVNQMLGFNYQIHFYRPPEGSTCERDLALARRMDITTVLWSYAYADYSVNNQPEVAASLKKAEEGLHQGCVYLLHAVSSTNAAMLGDLIDYIQGQGFELRRIDQ